jgi:hypothetical protein
VDEARIIERAPTLPGRTIRGGLPKNVALKDSASSYSKNYKYKPGYPDLRTMGIRVDGEGNECLTAIEAFSAKIANRTLRPGDKCISRIFGPPRKTHGVDINPTFPVGRKAESPIWVSTGSMPQTAEEWRGIYAVLDEWNGDKFRLAATVPEGGTKVPINGCFGKISEQASSKIPGQYLPGGASQAVVQLPESTHTLINKKYTEEFLPRIQDYIEAIEKANEEFLRTGVVPKLTVPLPEPVKWDDPETGLHCVLEATGWADANGHWGYAVRPDRAMTTVTEPLPDTAATVSKENAEVFVK